MSTIPVNKPKKIRTDAHQAFIDIIEEEDVGTYLYKFYRNYLNFGGSPNIYEKQKRKILNLNDRRISHLKSVVEKYDLEYIIECASVIVEGIDTGKIASSIVRPGYFDKVLLSKSSQNRDGDSGYSYD